MLLNFLAHPATATLGVPLMFMILGAVAKKIIRNERGLKRQDFYLGVQATLAAMSSSFLYVFELIRKHQAASTVPTPNLPSLGLPAPSNPGIVGDLASTVTFIFVAFFLLLFVLSLHQDWEAKDNNANPTQFYKLGLLANCVGLGLLGGFILFIKTG